MFVLGHAGIATGCVHALDRKADLRWIPIVALLPDLLDKPIWLFVPWIANGWSRSVAHSVTGLAVFALFSIRRFRERAWPFIFAYASHLVLDRMWWDPTILVWPYYGIQLPPYAFDHTELWWQKFTDLWTMGGEAIGAAILIGLAVRGRLWETEHRRAFTATGRLERAGAA